MTAKKNSGGSALYALIACVSVALHSSWNPARAQQDPYCVAPVKPACLALESTFERSLSIDRCGQDVEDYMTEIETYRQCLSDAIISAEQQAKNVRQAFECYSRGEDDCSPEGSEP